MVNESDVQKLEKGRKARQRQIQRLGIVEFKRRNAEQKAKERLRKIQTLGKSEYDRIINERAKNRQKKLILKLGTKLFLQDNPNTALPSEVVLIGIGDAERLRLNRIKDKKNRDAIQERGIERLGADEYWRRVYARRKKHREANPAMDEARKARLRTPEKRSQYAKYAKTKREKIGFRIGASIRGRVAGALYRFFGSSKGKGYRQGNSLECFGCSIDHLMFHFQQLFAEGMSFSNYGNGSGEWNVDHILCVAYFNKELENGTPDEIKAIEKMLNHFSNLVPLWSNENRIKNDTFPAWVKDRGCCFWTDLHEEYYKLRNYDVYLDETIDKDIERQIEDETRCSARTER